MQTAERRRELFDVAQQQGGYFTAKQAARLGYTANKRNYHVGAGNWVREHRGIYRLALFPAAHTIFPLIWPPPENWVAPFAAMAEECSHGIDAATAFQEVAAYLRDVRRQTQ